jgi:3-dehydroquinate synthase
MEVATEVRQRLSQLETAVAVLPDGEDAKTLEQLGRLYTALRDHNVTRRDTLVAVGGGTVTDIGGFAAATYLRGIEAVYIPTTLLGAVDAAIGGKTGINIEGKNLAGTFTQPARVVIDVDVLEELPLDLRIQGMAEVIKTGLVGDPDLVALLEQDGLDAPTQSVVEMAVAVKQAVVDVDFRENGLRRVLNYGHTIGHAIEVAAGVSHGEAIAVGMQAAGLIAERLTGFVELPRQKAIIEKLRLPTQIAADAGEVSRLVGYDKKRDDGGIKMVLLESIGAPVVLPVGDDLLEKAIAAVVGPG